MVGTKVKFRFRKSKKGKMKTSKEKVRACDFITGVLVCLLLVWLFLLVNYFYHRTDSEFLHPQSMQFHHQIETKGSTSLRAQPEVIEESIPLSGPEEDNNIHIIFSTDCQEYQDWQSLLLFHSAYVVGQRGRITRIASGCEPEKAALLSALYKRLYPRYDVHFTPDFSKDAKTNARYKFYNKPRGLKHWLEFANPPVGDNAIVALLDPDMIFLRALTTDLINDPNLLYDTRYYKKHNYEFPKKVEEGSPAAQLYGLGAPWTNENHRHFNKTILCGTGSPCLSVESNFGEHHYSVGPPYFVHKKDMIRLANTWTNLVPKVYEKYPFLLAEMYAYSMAAAHEVLPHTSVHHYMVSNTQAGGEGWDHVDALENICVRRDPVSNLFYPNSKLPILLHYCQSYGASSVGTFSKHNVHENTYFNCSSTFTPFTLPSDPQKVAENEAIPSGLERKQRNTLIFNRRSAFALCVIYDAINHAYDDFKRKC